jgi:hypothetical protein
VRSVVFSKGILCGDVISDSALCDRGSRRSGLGGGLLGRIFLALAAVGCSAVSSSAAESFKKRFSKGRSSVVRFSVEELSTVEASGAASQAEAL